MKISSWEILKDSDSQELGIIEMMEGDWNHFTALLTKEDILLLTITFEQERRLQEIIR